MPQPSSVTSYRRRTAIFSRGMAWKWTAGQQVLTQCCRACTTFPHVKLHIYMLQDAIFLCKFKHLSFINTGRIKRQEWRRVRCIYRGVCVCVCVCVFTQLYYTGFQQGSQCVCVCSNFIFNQILNFKIFILSCAAGPSNVAK